MIPFDTTRILSPLILLFLLAGHTAAQPNAAWAWKDRYGKTRTRAELDGILKQHEVWVKSESKSGVRADLHGAHLPGADLRGAQLTGADLRDTDLTDADLANANLDDADLRGGRLLRAYLESADLRNTHLEGAYLIEAHLDYDADLEGAHLNHANLGHADLDDAHLDGADLTDALLGDANLNGADLRDATLDGAALISANLSHSWLVGTHLKSRTLLMANLRGAVFEPVSVPEVAAIAYADNLEFLDYFENPAALVQLRKLFADAGFREQERKITYALKRREASISWDRCKSRRSGVESRAILW